jgi:hypothetical protein
MRSRRWRRRFISTQSLMLSGCTQAHENDLRLSICASGPVSESPSVSQSVSIPIPTPIPTPMIRTQGVFSEQRSHSSLRRGCERYQTPVFKPWGDLPAFSAASTLSFCLSRGLNRRVGAGCMCTYCRSMNSAYSRFSTRFDPSQEPNETTA